MCGIIAGVSSTPIAPYLLEGLERLEYRGYDSVGIAVAGGSHLVMRLRSTKRVKDLGRRVRDLDVPRLGTIGIGHTRWATHGEVSTRNAHPHNDCTGRLAIVHNGVIENAAELRELLVGLGHGFGSDVDSEVVAHLVEEARAGSSLLDAVREATDALVGSWALAVFDGTTDELVVASHQSPLVVAHSVHGHFAASDIGAIAPWVEDFQVLEDGDVVEINASPRWHRREGLPPEPELRARPPMHVQPSLVVHADYMSKEIEEQPEVAARIMTELGPRVADGELWRSLGLPDFARVTFLGCGTSLNAGRALGQLLTRNSGVPHQCIVASEVATASVEDKTLVMALSQSGETADVLRALSSNLLGSAPVLAVTNVGHSALGRRADAVVECSAGPEIGVAATKTYMAQLLTGTCIILSALVARGTLDPVRAAQLVGDLQRAPDLLAQAIGASRRAVPAIAEATSEAPGFLFLGRGAGWRFAEEGALKLTELTYRWAVSYPAGELKHGPLALVERGTPVVVVDDQARRLAVDISEVAARGGRVVRIGGPGSTIPALGNREATVLGIPWCGPFESVVAMQVLARELALTLGCDVDKPRNLAKSVTVH
ncbi:glutamine--fructose-6-phosphate transaminase (isomerizing) [Aeromicrobium sp. Leaf350]|uniref:glutamine--fructose-6-phosphate transaminase (isomerizing) n=1 Tax=Aeromicrobium sp. Leaf350 TaxID=2876565 RepID=UPI001E44BF9E|nr:glutamine--fructose-6-phosphate transaminase (isomerizing) [Aeromicrobium sp. Leaf350]